MRSRVILMRLSRRVDGHGSVAVATSLAERGDPDMARGDAGRGRETQGSMPGVTSGDGLAGRSMKTAIGKLIEVRIVVR
jgi:hypothetical protein